MNTVLDKPETREDLIKKGLLVLSRYSIEQTAAKFGALYNRTATLSSRAGWLSSA